MLFSDLSQDEMCSAQRELDLALFHHEQWCEGLNRTLICGLPPDRRDIADNAHRECRFGQWLYGSDPHSLARHPAFATIEALHERLHRCARDLLDASQKGGPIPLDGYERYANALSQLRLEMLSTKHEIEDAIHNLDPLTGAAGRIGLLTKLREQHVLVQRKVHRCCIAMVDIDHFKVVNDSYGHLMGDRVLTTFAHRMTSVLRPYDMIFRYGGEEFLICMPTQELESGYSAMDRLRQSLAEISFEVVGRPAFHVTVSAGLVLMDPDVPVETSIDRADKALYAAKTAGRNRVIVWDPSMK